MVTGSFGAEAPVNSTEGTAPTEVVGATALAAQSPAIVSSTAIVSSHTPFPNSMESLPTTLTPAPTYLRAYGERAKGPLRLHAFAPMVVNAANRHAVVFFFGGGWQRGTPEQFYPQSAALAARGMWAFCAEYRTATSHGTTPFDAVDDAMAAWAWLVAHADEFGLDSSRIVLGGGSAGAHLAAAVACRVRSAPYPAALLLFNPVIDNGPTGYGYERIGDRWREFSPMENLHGAMPPTLVQLGTEDRLVPVATGQEFQRRLLALGVPCDLELYEGEGHGFFNVARYADTLAKSEAFLERLGLLSPVAP